MAKSKKRNHQKKQSLIPKDAMSKAMALLEQGEHLKSIHLLEPLERKYPFANNEENVRFNSVYAYALSQAKRLLESEAIVKRGLELSPDKADLLFTHTFLKLSMREYHTACEIGSAYINALSNETTTGIAMFTGPSHHAQVLNMMGVAFRQLGDMENASKYFKISIQKDARVPLSYLNLAHLCLRDNLKEKALSILKKGMDSCGQIHELRMLHESVTNRPSVSACMIVKDEEELLAGCLESIRDWVDEIVVVDTGSSDKTVEIAKSFGAKLFHQKWEGDFSKHRNYSLEQATGDWLFVIDADERIVKEDVPLLLSVLAEKKHKLVSVNVFNTYGKNEDSTTFLPSTRLFRRDLDLRYEGIVHNLLLIPDDAKITRAEVKIKHLGYDLSKEKMAAKITRSRTLLEKQLNENPDNAFALFNYAQLLRGDAEENLSGNAGLILKSAYRAVELTDPTIRKDRHIHLMCLNQIAWTQLFSENYEEALNYANRALDLKNDYLDPLLLLGHIYAKKEEYSQAEEAYKKYLVVQNEYNPAAETDNIIVAHVDSRVNAFYGLGMLAEMRQDNISAKSYYLKTLDIDQHYLEANAHLGRIVLQEQDLPQAEILFKRQLESETFSSSAVVGLATVYRSTNREDQASNLFENWLEKHPEDRSMLISCAHFYLEAGLSEKVDKILNKLDKVSRDDTAVGRELSKIYFSQGDYARSAELLKEIVEGKQHSDPSLLNDYGNCHFKLGNLIEAEIWYKKATESAQLLPIAFRNHGLTLARMDKINEAIPQLSKYLELVPQDEEISSLLGEMLCQGNDYSAALAFFERRLSNVPDDLHALLKLSDCYLHMGHSDSAVIGYRRVLSIDPENRMAMRRLAQLSETVGRA